MNDATLIILAMFTSTAFLGVCFIFIWLKIDDLIKLLEAIERQLADKGKRNEQ